MTAVPLATRDANSKSVAYPYIVQGRIGINKSILTRGPPLLLKRRHRDRDRDRAVPCGEIGATSSTGRWATRSPTGESFLRPLESGEDDISGFEDISEDYAQHHP